MKSVRQILAAKETKLHSIEPSKSVYDAVVKMNDLDVGALLIMEGDELCGILSERDYTRKVIIKGLASKTTLVSDIMTKKVLYVGPDFTSDECLAIMTEKRMRHLPVLEDGKIIGMVSIGDAVKATISQQEFVIKQLETYIYGH